MLKFLFLIFVFHFNDFSIFAGDECQDLMRAYRVPLDLKDFSYYNNGMLVELEDGTKVFARSCVFCKHKGMFDFIQNRLGKIRKILWAGELLIVNNKIMEANETAGIYVEMQEICSGATITNLQNVATGNKEMAALFGNHTLFISYSSHEMHLSEALKEISNFRHNYGNPFLSVSFLYAAIFTLSGKPADFTAELSEAIKDSGSLCLRILTQIKELKVDLPLSQEEKNQLLSLLQKTCDKTAWSRQDYDLFKLLIEKIVSFSSYSQDVTMIHIK